MSTESPLIHDGAQTTAAVDMTTGFNGPSSTGQYLGVTISGPRIVRVNTSIGTNIYGILQNKPALGQACDVGILGVSKAVAGAAVSGGDRLCIDASGRFITASTSYHQVAVAIESAAATGVIFTVALTGASVS
jgi:hypothetical protein